jgi:thiamine biosynthesis protein ThiI
MKRGATVHYLHFYGTPFVGEEALNKVISLAKIANRYQPDPQPLLVVPFGKLQEKIALVTNPKMRTLLYRRMMVRIASMLAERMGAQALITGESLGQVASQTIENMTAINSVTRTMILRPLIGMDKSEIILRAKQWGTYQAAIGPGDDCCTLFADRHPSIRASESLLAEQESRLPIEEMTLEAVNSVEIHRIT